MKFTILTFLLASLPLIHAFPLASRDLSKPKNCLVNAIYTDQFPDGDRVRWRADFSSVNTAASDFCTYWYNRKEDPQHVILL